MPDLALFSARQGSTRRQPPSWLDAWRPDDSYAAQAYEQTPASRRALLKTAIALHVQVWGEAPAEENHCIASTTLGFIHSRAERPVAWTLAVLDPGYAAPARLLAALLPAALAGVEAVMVACPGQPPAPSLSVALELAGLENLYIRPATADRALPDLLQELAVSGEGRLLLFPTAQSRLSASFTALRETARTLRIRLWQDRPAPRIAVAGQPGAGAEELLRWAHGDAVLVPARAIPPQEDLKGRRNMAQACWIPAPGTPGFPCPLTLGPGLEAFWLADRLDRNFFRTVAHMVGFAQ